MRYVPASRIGKLLLLILVFLVVLIILSDLFGGFQKGTKFGGAPPAAPAFIVTGR